MQDHNKQAMAGLTLAALGVVYGDIGTSPLYTLRECFTGHGIATTPENILGILSLIFWSLIFVVSLKYVAFILRADNRGEGGIMALTALAAKAAGSTPRGHLALLLLGVMGASLFYGDSVITPAISVLSAVEGLEVATFPADLTNLEGLPGLVDAIETQVGAIDVAVYSPVPSKGGYVPATQFDAAAVQDLVPIYTLAPIELAHGLTMIMKKRGAGAIVVVGGLAAVRPIPGVSGAPALMAATRNYIHALHGELAQSGVFAGAVYIGAMIEGSTGMKVATSGGRTIDPRLPTISPDTIAEAIWRLTTERTQVEAILPAISQS